MSDTAITIAAAPHAGEAVRPPRAAAGLRRWLWRLAPWALPAVLFALWTVGCARGWIAPQILPPPERVVDSLAELAASGDLARHTLVSLQRVLLGFALGTLLGFVTGAALGLSRTAAAYVLPSFNAIVQIPVLGWLPFLLLLVGVGEPLKYLLIAHAALVPVTLSTLQGFRQAPAALDEVARGFGYSHRQRILHVVLPAAVPTLATGVRLAFTKSWLALVVVELVASSEGLGYLIVYGRQLFQLDLVMAAVVVVGAVGFAINRLLDALEARLRRGLPSAFRG
ncbi:ABC transporter permease [Burkholderia stagnalis]|uniref:Sulfonate ABC transporter n=1 Tax=Burkholderia stagnalis TaxID=1503054 RepID=A0A125LBE7_9BURK|nr:ABC transporter permease [Burkholderia stagnalis]KVZ02620.1 sulfonate ABC transporter [Burkholderia stagnalis]KWA53735.1 sulfonate ABC transporter [Burkholderia stagnalis]KWA58849.1 sulfonate ABC transporter [Burkholderia stagnalis]KWA60736.1 sulfonate ABC transporter [Burkholderia stagnalis]KWC97612.1 sulfonate ABC transporter [Burkholderia stagnalis]